MDSEILNRLKKLMKALGLSVAEGSYTMAELKAYTAALELAFSKMEEMHKSLFIDTAEGTGLALFLSMVGKSYTGSIEQARQAVIEQVTQNIGKFMLSDFESRLNTLFGGFLPPEYEVNGNVVTVKYVGVLDDTYMRYVSEFYNNDLPCFCMLSMDASGLPFFYLDSFELRWFELDALELPFYILESL